MEAALARLGDLELPSAPDAEPHSTPSRQTRPHLAALAADAATNAIAAMLTSEGVLLDPTLPGRDRVREEIQQWITASMMD